MRLEALLSRSIILPFQSTHPVRGATRNFAYVAGEDSDFNPRTPCGVRLKAAYTGLPFGKFQSTHPVRGATQEGGKGNMYNQFQSTHPVRGATTALEIPLAKPINFNPRTPCGVRRHSTHNLIGNMGISIHAPRAGCDNRIMDWQMPLPYFNPRTPCGVRPWLMGLTMVSG